MFFILRSAFWLGLALFIIQPHGLDLPGSARTLGAQAVESGRTAALNGLDTVECASLECAGAKLVAKSALDAHAPPREIVVNAPFPVAPLGRSRI